MNPIAISKTPFKKLNAPRTQMIKSKAAAQEIADYIEQGNNLPVTCDIVRCRM
jgi:hypothetical protein